MTDLSPVGDIVERLRALADEFYQHAPYYCEAADEIERLRQHVALLKVYRDDQTVEIERLRGENSKLHDALDRMANAGPLTVGHWRALRVALGMKP